VVIVAAAWILDPAACAGMAFGAPRVAVSALVELHQLLIEHGFRRSSRDDPTVLESAKLNGLDPEAWLTDVIVRMAKGHPVNRLSELLPWHWQNQIASLTA
jgi:hypothetical protein